MCTARSVGRHEELFNNRRTRSGALCLARDYRANASGITAYVIGL